MSNSFFLKNNFNHLSDTGEMLTSAVKAEDIENAEKKGFDKGVDIGHKTAYEEIDAMCNTLMISLSSQLEKMLHQQKKIHDVLDEHVMKLAFEAFEKLLPGFVASDQFQTAFQRLGEAMSLVDQDKDILLKVSPALHDAIREKIKKGVKDVSILQHVKVETDAHLDPTDFKLKWEGGSLSYAQRRLEKALVALLSPNQPLSQEENQKLTNPQQGSET